MSDFENDQPLESIECEVDGLEERGLRTVKLCPDGLVKSKSGTFFVDKASAKLLVSDFDTHAVEVPVDFGHSTVYVQAGGRTDAAGWITKVWHDAGKGLYALVRWNRRTIPLIREGAYGYLSPVLSVRVIDRAAVALHSVALTNKPAIPAMERVVASVHNDSESKPMPDETKDTDVKGIVAAIAKLLAIDVGDDMLKDLAAIRDAVASKLKAKPETDQSDNDRVASSVRERLGLASDATCPEVVLAMAAGDAAGPAATELVKMREAETDRVAHAMVDRYVKATRLSPKDAGAMDAALELAKTAPDKLEAIMANAAPIHPVGKTTAPTSRQQLILASAREFRTDDDLKKTTEVTSYVSLKLQDAGYDRLTDEEGKELAA